MTGADLSASLDVRRGTARVRVDVAVPAGERLTVLGPNGAGKSTLLAALAGFLAPHAGEVVLGGRMLEGPGTRVPPARRRVTLLDQKPRLFPHLDLRRNIAFGPLAQGRGRAEAARIADEWLRRLGLDHRAGDRPHRLSGGQQQRVAIARAFAAQPELMLLDEPFSSLDAAAAPEMRALLTAELARTGTTSVLVTHDLADAWQWSDRCVVLDHGTVVADTSPAEIAERPQHPFTAALAGFGVLRGSWTGTALDVDGVRLPAIADGPLAAGDAAFAVVRPAAVRVGAPGEEGAIAGTVQDLSLRSGRMLVRHSTGLIADLEPAHRAGGGQTLWLAPTGLRVRALPPSPRPERAG